MTRPTPPARAGWPRCGHVERFGPMQVRAVVVDDDAAYTVDLHVGPGRLAWSCSGPGSTWVFCQHCVAAAVETSRRSGRWRLAATPAGSSGHAPATVATRRTAQSLPLPAERDRIRGGDPGRGGASGRGGAAGRGGEPPAAPAPRPTPLVQPAAGPRLTGVQASMLSSPAAAELRSFSGERSAWPASVPAATGRLRPAGGAGGRHPAVRQAGHLPRQRRPGRHAGGLRAAWRPVPAAGP